MGAGVFRADFFSLLRSRVNFWGHQWFPFVFFVEGSILAQDERWRRALHMQVERDPSSLLGGESGERVSNA